MALPTNPFVSKEWGFSPSFHSIPLVALFQGARPRTARAKVKLDICYIYIYRYRKREDHTEVTSLSLWLYWRR